MSAQDDAIPLRILKTLSLSTHCSGVRKQAVIKGSEYAVAESGNHLLSLLHASSDGASRTQSIRRQVEGPENLGAVTCPCKRRLGSFGSELRRLLGKEPNNENF
ncbi:unnamed protein product [Calicophoron daubneyi]|uniref:Uncharacterized protein n=1 Tax=Calicophoron daubneyi TaxID=300641 RepID=A0AAV2TZ48_CALDB